MGVIEFNDVSFIYPNGFKAVDNVSFSIAESDNIAIIGQNGAGKTTTVKMMNGLLRPSEGRVFVTGEDTTRFTTAQLSRKVGYVFQNPDDQIFHETVEKEISFGPRILGFHESRIKELVNQAAELCGLSNFLEENPYHLPLSVRKFVAIASVLAMDGDVVILDEPTAGQDPLGISMLQSILSELQKNNKTIITITHDMEFVIKNFNTIFVMANKKLLKIGRPHEIFYDNDLVELAMLKKPYIVDLVDRIYQNHTKKSENQRTIESVDDFVFHFTQDFSK